ncbi:hypothetical protein [Nostoc sp.]
MNRRWKRFLALCLTALLVVTQLQPARAGFGIGGFEIPTSPADDYGKAAAAASSGSATASNHFGVVQKDSQKVAVCVLGVCVDVPNIPILNPKAPSQNQPTPTISLEQPSNTEQETPLASDNEKPTTDLTGTWIWRGTPFSIHKGGCTAGYTGELTFNGQNADQGVEITVTQKNNQVLIPGTAVAYSPGLSQRYTESSQGTISGNRFSFRTLGNPSFADSTIDHIGTVSNDGNTITGESFCKSSSGSATAKGTFTWTRKVSLAQCPRFKTMLSEAKELQKIADTLERDDKAYFDAVIDVIIRGYSSPYAVYMLDVSSKEIPKLFKDETQIRAVRSQIIERIRTKARNRERFANIGINGDFIPNVPVYSKENIELFCTLDSSKFTKEFWDSLWMAGYIDYNLYTQVENQLIVYGYKNYFETLADIATLPVAEAASLSLYAFKVGFKNLFLTLTEFAVGAIKQLESKTLPRVTIKQVSTVLPEGIAATFKDGKYVNRLTRVEETFYRYHGKSNLSGNEYVWFTTKKYTSEEEVRNGLAIAKEWGIELDSISTIRVPKNTWLSEGKAASQIELPGGGFKYLGGEYQAVIKNIPKDWVITNIEKAW